MELRSSDFRGKTFQYQCDPGVHSSWWTFDDERDVRDALWNVHEGDVVLDIGAGFGSYSLSSLAVGAVFAHAWGMEEDHYALFQESLKANGWEDRCIINHNGLLDMPGWYRWQTREFSPSPKEGFVFVDSIDNMMERDGSFSVGPHYLMKIDTEGAEYEILLGAEKFLKQSRPTILVENHDFLRPGATDLVRNYLLSQGFVLTVDRPSSMCTHSLYSPT